MENKKQEIQVGLVVIVAMVALIIGLMWLKNVSVSRGIHYYSVDFPTVEGLQVRDRVQVRGIRLGQVKAFEILDDHVRVSIELENSVDLRDDAKISLGTKGIVGEVVIEIDPGQGEKVSDGHIFAGHTLISITSMTESAGGALNEMKKLTIKVTELVDEISSSGKLVETLNHAQNTMAQVDSLVSENRNNLHATLGNLRSASEGLQRIMASGSIDQLITDASGTMTKADSLVVSLNKSATRLNILMDKVEDGDGTISKLLNDSMLYDRADSTMVSVKRLVEAFRRNPKRFLDLSVIDF